MDKNSKRPQNSYRKHSQNTAKTA